jgi:hypothetical protein
MNLYAFVHNNAVSRRDALGLCDDYLDYLQQQEAEAAMMDDIMGDGFTEYMDDMRDWALSLIPNEGFVFIGGEADAGPVQGEVLGLAGFSGRYYEPFTGGLVAGGVGPFSGGFEYTTTDGWEPIGLFDPEIDGWNYGAGVYVSPASHGFFGYVGIGHYGFVGFGFGRCNGH